MPNRFTILDSEYPRCLQRQSRLQFTRALCSTFRALEWSRQLHPPERLRLGYPSSDLARSLPVTFALATAACSEHRSDMCVVSKFDSVVLG
jgi:hypothetical protein